MSGVSPRMAIRMRSFLVIEQLFLYIAISLGRDAPAAASIALMGLKFGRRNDQVKPTHLLVEVHQPVRSRAVEVEAVPFLQFPLTLLELHSQRALQDHEALLPVVRQGVFRGHTPGLQAAD